MTSLGESVAANCCNRLIDGAIREAHYLCCFNTYATKFEKEKGQLIAIRNDVQNDIVQEARQYNKTRVVEEVRQWIDDANAVINEGTITREKCFCGMCSNCVSQYRLGKKLEEKTLDITGLLERKRQFTRVARSSKNPAIKLYASPSFIDFESRRPIFNELVAALGNGNYCMIGLQGLVGMGKTTLALQVGLHVGQSDSFQEVIFTTVSDSPDINQIRRSIARQLDFQLEGEEEQHPEALWSRIADSEGKVLIILDDIWEKLELRGIGIPYNHKNCCVLITTRHPKVCEAMECQPTFSLNTLKDSDVLDIFTEVVGRRSQDSSRELKILAEKTVNVCGGLPLAVVRIATMLQGFDEGRWRMILTPLLNSEPLHNDYVDWTKVGNGLKLIYDGLENEPKGLLLLCSLFPKNHEIPVELLSRLGIGLGLLGEVKNYSRLRDELILATKDLKKSFLLLETKEACVRIYDLVRKVALEDKDVQVITNSGGELKSNLKLLSWSNSGFPNHFDGTELKVLLLWIKGQVKVKDLYAIFQEMVNLRVLFLHCDKDAVYPTLSPQSFLSLKNIRTLILNGWGLGDILILKHLNNLVSLEFENCLIMDLPKDIVEVENLRLLGIRCKILGKNPFEVIARCSRLEVLYFVNNDQDIDSKPNDNEKNEDEVTHAQSHPALQMYSVACSGLQYFVEDDNGLSKCFNTRHMKKLISEEMLKYLVGRAEILELWEMGETRWTSLVPDIIPTQDEVMQGLNKLCLYHCTDIECLVDNRRRSSNVSVFSYLVELHLVDVNVEDLWWGRMPSGFLSELKVFKLLRCMNLRNNFFHGHLILPRLKVLQLDDCPMFNASIFRPSVALSLVLLEELSIKDCEQVETLIEYESPREEVVVADHQHGDGFLFPKLKSLKIQGCGKLQLVLPFLLAGDLCVLEDLSIRSCENLEYIFGEYRAEGQVLQKKSMLPSLTTMELEAVPSFINTCKTCTKCMQSAYPTLEHDSNDQHTNSKTRASTCAHGCCCLPTSSSESVKRNETSHPTYQRPLRQLSSFRNIREMTLTACSKSESLFCVPIATIIMMEKLKIQGCHKLKHIVSMEREKRDDVNSSSIFPELKKIEIKDCDGLEFLFPSTFSASLQRLTGIGIHGTPKLRYIFGGYRHEEPFSDKNEENEVPIKLLALEKLFLTSVPQIISMCAKNYHLEWPSLKHINLGHCGELVKRPFPHSMVCLQGRQLTLETGDQESIRGPCPDSMDCLRRRRPNLETEVDAMKLLMEMQRLTNLGIRNSEIEEIFNLEGIKPKVKVELKLQVLEIEGLHNLRCIYKDPNRILNLCNLEDLVFSGCDQLRAIFSTSTMKRLPRLSYLKVTQCRGLVYIIEDDDDSRQLRLSRLQIIHISHCNNLESLFSISTFSTLLKLESLEIEEASSLKEVFGCRQDDTQERTLQDVVPELLHFKLKNLRNLERFCGGIDVQSVEKSVKKFEVVDCGIWGKPIELKRNEEMEQANTSQAMPHISDVGTSTQVLSHSHLEGEAKRKQEIETQGQTSALPNLEENIEEVTRKTGEVPFSETSAVASSSSSSDSALTRRLSMEETMVTQANSSAPALQKKASETSAAESEMTRTSPHHDPEEVKTNIVALQKNDIGFDRNNDATRNERVREGLTSKDDGEATPLTDVAPRNSPATLVTPPQCAKGEAKRKQEMETQRPTSAIQNLAENIEEVTRKTGEVPFSETSAVASSSSDSALTRGLTAEETMENQASGAAPALEKEASGTPPAESKTAGTCLQRAKEAGKEIVEVVPPMGKALEANVPRVIPSYHQEALEKHPKLGLSCKLIFDALGTEVKKAKLET